MKFKKIKAPLVATRKINHLIVVYLKSPGQNCIPVVQKKNLNNILLRYVYEK